MANRCEQPAATAFDSHNLCVSYCSTHPVLLAHCCTASLTLLYAFLPYTAAFHAICARLTARCRLLQVLTISSGPATAVKPKKAGTAKAKTSEPAFNITVETECIAEHALQVSRMLPGGISVIGLYLFAPESGYNNCSNQLCKTLTTIAADMSKSSISSTVLEAAAAVTGTAAVTTGAGSPPAELLLLHVDSASRKFTVRTCQVSIPASVNFTVKPCELKFGSSLSSLVPLQCTHKFHLTAPTAAPAAAGEGTLTMQQLLQNAVAAESARVLSAVAAAAGQILTSSSQPIGDLLTSSSSSSDGSREAAVVDLYCLPTTAAALHSSSSSSATVNVSGNSWLQGTVEALAYVHKRDPVSKALLEIKNDVIASLAARLQLLADEALVAADDATADYTAAAAAAENGLPPAAAAAHPLLESTAAGQRVVINLARRVLLPWGDLNLQVC